MGVSKLRIFDQYFFNLMSQLVEDHFFIEFQTFSPVDSNLPSYRDQLLDGIARIIQKANTEGYKFKIQQPLLHKSQGRFKATAYLQSNTSMFDFLAEIIVDVKSKKIKCKTAFIDQEKYLCAQSTAKRKIICRKFLKINNLVEYQGLKFIQDMQSGKIALMTVGSEHEWVFHSKETIWKKLKLMLRKIWDVCTMYWSQIVQMCEKERYRNYCIRNGREQYRKIKIQQQSFGKVVKQVNVSHINFGFNSRADQSSFPAFEKSHQHQKKLKELIMNSSCDTFQRKSRKLFATSIEQLLGIPEQTIKYQVEQSQAKLYGSYLKSPVPKDPNIGQNKFIFNHIQIVNPQAIKFRQTRFQGGNSKIMVSNLSFYYCDSNSLQQSKMKSVPFENMSLFNPNIKSPQESKQKQISPVLTKMIAVKLSNKKSYQELDEKSQNEKKIIRQFKNGVSAYILKYYCSAQTSFYFRDNLLLDFLPNSQPLSNYIEIFKDTLSLNSKAYIIVNLVNSIRFLSDYQVVHMDLNLNNFLMYRDYLTKLIDFGEAYCPQVNKSSGVNLKRGYTFPFCSPEYFERKCNFTSKQDVFSLGVIIWRLIFNDYPWITSKKAVDSYKNKKYLSRMLLAPQRGQGYGSSGQTIDLVYRILFKCLNPLEQLRCETSWLTIFFKLIYFYLL